MRLSVYATDYSDPVSGVVAVPLINPNSVVAQSSTIWAAERAVDGRNARVPESTSHTHGETDPWWMVNLPYNSTVTKIRIWNRVDCCWEKLYGAKIMLHLADGTWETVATYPSDPSPAHDFDLGHVDGVLQIKIMLEGDHKQLALGEVQVWGYLQPIDLPSNPQAETSSAKKKKEYKTQDHSHDAET